MNKRMVALVAGGALAGAAVVGLPTLALAGQDTPTEEPTTTASPGTDAMGSMMSDPQLQEQMKTFMVEMMGDEELREQMRSMMSDAMGDMGDMGDMGGMGGMDSGEMGSGEMGGMGSGEMGSGDAEDQPQDDQTP